MAVIQFGTHTFTSQEKACDYIRHLLTTIGLCDSVKAKSNTWFQDIYHILLRHPNAEDKLHHLEDFSVVRNVLKPSSFVIHIKKKDGTVDDVSWLSCVTGKPRSAKQLLHSALRYSIEPQIQQYRDSISLDQCVLCQSSTNGTPHIDHFVQFEQLVHDFYQTITIPVPNEVDAVNDYSGRRCFKSTDQTFQELWEDYHRKHASLRVLCATCNLSRPKIGL